MNLHGSLQPSMQDHSEDYRHQQTQGVDVIVIVIMSEALANSDRQRPPAGSPPDYEAIDRAQGEHNAGIAHVPVEDFSELAASVRVIAENLNVARVGVGAPRIHLDTSMVRLIEPQHWDTLQSESNAIEARAFYDPLSGNTYQIFDKKRYAASKTEQIMTAYTIAHELSHKATEGLSDYSFNLCEGIADLLARDSLENGGLSSIINKEELDRYRQRYLEKVVGPLVIKGDEYTAKDIFVIPGEPGIGLTRIPQLRLVEALQTHMGGDLFDTFLRSAFTADITAMKRILEDRFGGALAQGFNDRSGRISAHSLTRGIQQATACLYIQLRPQDIPRS